MKSIGQHVSNIRGLLNQYTRTSEPYTDQFLYEALCISRATILKQRLDSFKAISSDNWYRICISLEQTKSHNCSCVPNYLDCKVLRTTQKIPQVLSSRNKAKVEISLLNGTRINLVTEAEWLVIKLNEYKAREYYASNVNGYIYFWNLPLNLKVVQINGLWADMSGIANINCNDSMITTPCFDMLEQDFPLDEELADPIYTKAIQLLNIPLQLVSDKTNDNNESIK